MKLENVLYVLFLLPLFVFSLWTGVVYAKGFYNWYVWYSAGAEVMVAEGPVIAVATPTRKGTSQYRIVIKDKDGDKVKVYADISYELYRSLANYARRRSDFPYTAEYTVGVIGEDQMFRLSARGRVLFEKSIDYGSRPEQIISAIAILILCIGGSVILVVMMTRELKNKEKN